MKNGYTGSLSDPQIERLCEKSMGLPPAAIKDLWRKASIDVRNVEVRPDGVVQLNIAAVVREPERFYPISISNPSFLAPPCPAATRSTIDAGKDKD